MFAGADELHTALRSSYPMRQLIERVLNVSEDCCENMALTTGLAANILFMAKIGTAI
jgi:hypothetical protein